MTQQLFSPTKNQIDIMSEYDVPTNKHQMLFNAFMEVRIELGQKLDDESSIDYGLRTFLNIGKEYDALEPFLATVH
ncbi:hypothetical protein NTE28_003585 [Vibrio harveyi]|nr:hypothetical protein [Vibrio harveyi]